MSLHSSIENLYETYRDMSPPTAYSYMNMNFPYTYENFTSFLEILGIVGRCMNVTGINCNKADKFLLGTITPDEIDEYTSSITSKAECGAAINVAYISTTDDLLTYLKIAKDNVINEITMCLNDEIEYQKNEQSDDEEYQKNEQSDDEENLITYYNKLLHPQNISNILEHYSYFKIGQYYIFLLQLDSFDENDFPQHN